MTHRVLYVGRRVVDFLFAEDDYDLDEIVTYLKDAGATEGLLEDAVDLMTACDFNCGFTFTNPEDKTAVVLIGPSTSGAEFKDTFTHEMYHLAEGIAADIGIELSKEVPAYIAGNAARELSDIVCMLGCRPDLLYKQHA